MSLKEGKNVRIKLTQYVQRVIIDSDIHTELWLESPTHVIDLNQVVIINRVQLLKYELFQNPQNVNPLQGN
jgi:hypothetical protein